MPSTKSGVKGKPGYESVRKNSQKRRDSDAFIEGYAQGGAKLERGAQSSLEAALIRSDTKADLNYLGRKSNEEFHPPKSSDPDVNSYHALHRQTWDEAAKTHGFNKK